MGLDGRFLPRYWVGREKFEIFKNALTMKLNITAMKMTFRFSDFTKEFSTRHSFVTKQSWPNVKINGFVSRKKFGDDKSAHFERFR